MPDDRTIDFVIMFIVLGSVGLGLLSMAVGWVSNVLRGVMSNEDAEGDLFAASALGTDAGRTQDGPEPRDISGKELFPLYQLMRRYNIPRDEAQAALKASGLPLSNGVWSKAAPPPPQDVTPIAHRPTAAKFHEGDPELEYQPLR